MDRFLVKRPRTADAEACAKRPRASGLPVNLAVCAPVEAICAAEKTALELFDAYPVDSWYDLGPYLHNRQLLFGPRPGSHRTPHEERMPPVLLSIFAEARAALCAHSSHFADVPEVPSGCAINRYEPTANKRGSGLGPHRDKGLWKPLVVGVTLVESREMAFGEWGPNGEATRRHRITTQRGSVYAFRDELYTRWFHESLKKGPTQKRTIYSITYRFL